MPYSRPETSLLSRRLGEPVRFMIILAGPRQVGKTRAVRDVLQDWPRSRYLYIGVDQPADESRPFLDAGATTTAENENGQRDSTWLTRLWLRARAMASQSNLSGLSDTKFVLVLDEIQKIPNWSETVKGLWDADRANDLHMHVVLLGSSPLLMQKGLTESLAGRYELIRLGHWSYTEMQEAFDFNLDEYIYYGGYPGAASLIRDEPRWRDYVRASLVEPNIEKDILLMTRVDKPALLKQLFRMGCEYSGQILSYTKMLGQLQDAGNTVTLAHYLELLSNAGLITALQKYAGQQHRRRASVPKLNVLNTALMTSGSGYSFAQAQADRTWWGRLVESAVGAHLYNSCLAECRLYYWRESPREVDFVLEQGNRLVAIEVKSGPSSGHAPGLEAFAAAFGECRQLVVGDGGIPLAEFLSYPATHWFD